MEDKVEKWLEKRSQNIREEWKDFTLDYISDVKSPIEKLFLVEWRYRTAFYSDYENFYIKPQYKINSYIVDS